MISKLMELQGTVWQERLLFLQQNTEVYRWVCVGVFAVVGLIVGMLVLYIGRFRMGLKVSSLCFVPGVNLLVIPYGVVKAIFGAIGRGIKSTSEKMATMEKKPKKIKGKKGGKVTESGDDFSLFDDDSEGSSSSEEESVGDFW